MKYNSKNTNVSTGIPTDSMDTLESHKAGNNLSSQFGGGAIK